MTTNNDMKWQVSINGQWGSICSDGWTMQSASIACNQLGLVLNPDDWNLSYDNPSDPSSGEMMMTHVDCSALDTDLRQCRHETTVENYCRNAAVSLRCQEVSWAGLRFAMTARKSILKAATVERAGLYDYATRSFQPAVRIDLHHHVLDQLTLSGNQHDGLGIIYSDIYYPEAIPNLRRSEMSRNGRHGLSVRSLGIRMDACHIEDNAAAGIHYDPVVRRQELREMVGWLAILKDENFIVIPDVSGSVELIQGVPRYLKTSRVKDQ